MPAKPMIIVIIRQVKIVVKTVIGIKNHVISIIRTIILHAEIVATKADINDVAMPKRPYSIMKDFRIV